MSKILDTIVPAPLRKPAKPGSEGVPKDPAPKDLKTTPERQTEYQKLGQIVLETATSAQGGSGT